MILSAKTGEGPRLWFNIVYPLNTRCFLFDRWCVFGKILQRSRELFEITILVNIRVVCTYIKFTKSIWTKPRNEQVVPRKTHFRGSWRMILLYFNSKCISCKTSLQTCKTCSGLCTWYNKWLRADLNTKWAKNYLLSLENLQKLPLILLPFSMELQSPEVGREPHKTYRM